MEKRITKTYDQEFKMEAVKLATYNRSQKSSRGTRGSQGHSIRMDERV